MQKANSNKYNILFKLIKDSVEWLDIDTPNVKVILSDIDTKFYNKLKNNNFVKKGDVYTDLNEAAKELKRRKNINSEVGFSIMGLFWLGPEDSPELLYKIKQLLIKSGTNFTGFRSKIDSRGDLDEEKDFKNIKDINILYMSLNHCDSQNKMNPYPFALQYRTKYGNMSDKINFSTILSYYLTMIQYILGIYTIKENKLFVNGGINLYGNEFHYDLVDKLFIDYYSNPPRIGKIKQENVYANKYNEIFNKEFEKYAASKPNNLYNMYENFVMDTEILSNDDIKAADYLYKYRYINLKKENPNKIYITPLTRCIMTNYFFKATIHAGQFIEFFHLYYRDYIRKDAISSKYIPNPNINFENEIKKYRTWIENNGYIPEKTKSGLIPEGFYDFLEKRLDKMFKVPVTCELYDTFYGFISDFQSMYDAIDDNGNTIDIQLVKKI